MATGSPSSGVWNGNFGATSTGSNRNNGRIYTRMDSCLVIPPPNGKKPRAIIKFLGGAFIGAVPELTYRLYFYPQFSKFIILVETLKLK